jgi:hypothetical protein
LKKQWRFFKNLKKALLPKLGIVALNRILGWGFLFVLFQKKKQKHPQYALVHAKDFI